MYACRVEAVGIVSVNRLEYVEVGVRVSVG
jgi:hypothetical protein